MGGFWVRVGRVAVWEKQSSTSILLNGFPFQLQQIGKFESTTHLNSLMHLKSQVFLVASPSHWQVERLVRKMLLKIINIALPITLNPSTQFLGTKVNMPQDTTSSYKFIISTPRQHLHQVTSDPWKNWKSR